jgi:hypothetical protein
VLLADSQLTLAWQKVLVALAVMSIHRGDAFLKKILSEHERWSRSVLSLRGCSQYSGVQLQAHSSYCFLTLLVIA